jgi:hypothetical protein
LEQKEKGGAMITDTQKFFEAIKEPEQVIEVRVIRTDKDIRSGFYTDREKLYQDVAKQDIDTTVKGIYTILNEIDPDIIEQRPPNQINRISKGRATSSKDIIRRQCLYVDVDPVKPTEFTNSSSSDAEKKEAIIRASKCEDFLTALGWPEPIRGDSGNGAHLIYRIDLLNDDAATELISGVLALLNEKFGVDVSVKDAARIGKVYGTMVRKGEDTPERPYRTAKLISVPDVFTCVKEEQLRSIANQFVSVGDSGKTIKTTDKKFTMPEPGTVTPGTRHRTWTQLIASMVGRRNSYEAILAACLAENKTFSPPKPDSEVIEEVKSIYQWAQGKETEKRRECEALITGTDTSAITNQMIGDDDEDEEYEELLPCSKREIPEHLLKIPGVLNEFRQYVNDISVRSQPQFDVQTALALGATVLGRHYSTDQNNYSSLYFINIAETSMGKEKADTAIKNALGEARRPDLIGPSSYTGSGGVYSTLIFYPSHITIIDELGLLLESNKNQKNGLATQTMRILMSVWGKLDSSIVVEGYSDMKKIVRDGITNSKPGEKMIINNPAITLLGMTTSKTFYDALTGNDVKSGYIPRMLVSEYNGPVPKAKRIKNVDVPDAVVKWIEKYTNGFPQDTPVLSPTQTVLKISEESWKILDEIEDDLLGKMNDPKSGETAIAIYGKTREMIMRLSLIVAASDEKEEILKDHVEWARDYVMFFTEQLIERTNTSLSASQLEKVSDEIIRKISKAGEHGLTEREIFQQCWSVRGMLKKTRDSVMETMKGDRGICKQKIEGFPKREAWIEKKYKTKCS